MFDERGAVVQERGVTAVARPVLPRAAVEHTRGSALLGWVGDDAEHLAGVVAAPGAAA